MVTERPLLKEDSLSGWPCYSGALGGAPLYVTKSFSGDRDKELDRFLADFRKLGRVPRFLKQIHSDLIRDPGEHPEDHCLEGDAWLTHEDPWLGIRTADCGPVALVDPDAGIRSLVHSGWRGTDQGILPKAVQAMVRAGAEPSRIQAFLGPLMRGCCYEVGDEVGLRFANEFPGSYRQGKDGKGFLALESVLKTQLAQAGIHGLTDSGWCTGCSGLPFHSYRREGEAAGRTLTILGPVPQGGTQ